MERLILDSPGVTTATQPWAVSETTFFSLQRPPEPAKLTGINFRMDRSSDPS